MIEKVKVLIVDDHKMFCESLATLLSMTDEVEVLGTANCGKEAIKKAELLKPDIVLLDIEMKDLDGIEAMRKIKEKFPDIAFIMLTMHPDEEYVMEAIKAGAKGYVLKESSSSEVLEAIRTVSQGNSFFGSNSFRKVIENFQHHYESVKRFKEEGNVLTQRELEVLKLIAEGYTNREISNKLFISPHTTRNHIANIFMKLNCNTRTKAVIEAQKRRLI
jgi:DNA-binding NarL/FixJ family response regulator